MAHFGYPLMTERSGPKELVQHAISAEECGFDFEVCSEHFSPWLTSQGHAPNAWVVLGARVVDEEMVIDGNGTTSRSPADLAAFCSAVIQQLAF